MTKEIPKEMMPIFIKNSRGETIVKPLIHALFEKFFQLGIREYCMIVGRQKRAIEDHFTVDHGFLDSINSKNNLKNELRRFYDMLTQARIFWINQNQQRGFGNAVLYSESFVGDDEFLVSAGDTYIPQNHAMINQLLNLKLKGKNDALLVLKEVPDPRRFGVAVVTKFRRELRVTDVEEKPKHPKSNLSIVALYRFKPSIFETLKEIQKTRNEIQLTDAIQKLIERGGQVKALLMKNDDTIIDVGTAESYLETFRD